MAALWLIAAAVVALDQGTKWWVLRNIQVDQPWVVIDGFFRLVHWYNTGAAWGMFQGANTILIIVSLITAAAIVYFRGALHAHHPVCRAALGLLIGGVLGNVIDRFQHGAVLDFLDFHVGARHWPAFNVADSAICVGVALYIIVSWRLDAAAAKPADKPSPSAD